MDVQLFGINQLTAPIELRERLSLDGAGVADLLRNMIAQAPVAEAVLASSSRV